MMKALKSLSLFGGLAVVLTLFLVIGCSNYSPVQPENPNPIESGKITRLSGGDVPAGETVLEVYDSKLIDKDEGGTIVVDRNEFSHDFVVEPNAIEQNTTISIRSVNETILGKDMILFEFGPDGLEFSKSAKLKFEIAELDSEAASAKLYYYDPGEKVWVYQGSSNVVEGIAVFEIDHFSKYAISD